MVIKSLLYSKPSKMLISFIEVPFFIEMPLQNLSSKPEKVLAIPKRVFFGIAFLMF